ncbi:MAG: DUF3352 domain-containing protein [Anaerolineae bacterium]|nr:DUF3352 domain-containing protein [Anaerolineae bacterium]
MGLLAVALFWLLPRLLGADTEAIVQTMPDDTAVFAEINLLQLQDSASRQAASSFEESYNAADIPFNAADPSTIFNGLDATLHSLAGVTVSEDVRPWVGVNFGVGLLPMVDGQSRWLLVATVRDAAEAAAFITKVNAIGEATAGSYDDLVLVASDAATLAAAQTDGLSLADSRRYQETMAQLPQERAATLYVHMQEAAELWQTAVPTENQGIIQALQGVQPAYTTLGLAAYATEVGIQAEMVGLHEPLNETQQMLLTAQTAVPTTDTMLPANTAVYLTGQRLDLLWKLLKGSLDGLGYSAADVDEATELFAGLFGFNPDTDLLAALDGPSAVALLPVGGEQSVGETAVPGFSVVLLAEHNNPQELPDQAASLAAGLTQLGFEANQTTGVYEVTDPDGRPLAAYTVYGDYLLVGSERVGVTAVTELTTTLANAPGDYQGVWGLLPPNAKPLLFADVTQLTEPFALNADTLPITQAVLGTTSDETISRATLILVLKNRNE